MKKFTQNLLSSLSASHSAALSLERRLTIQTTLVRGQNLQMMDFADLGRPSMRAHLAHPIIARIMPSSRAVARVLKVTRWIGVVVAYALAVVIGIVLAAIAGHFTVG